MKVRVCFVSSLFILDHVDIVLGLGLGLSLGLGLESLGFSGFSDIDCSVAKVVGRPLWDIMLASLSGADSSCKIATRISNLMRAPSQETNKQK